MSRAVIAQCDSTKQYMLNIADRAMPAGSSANSGVPIREVSPDYTFYSVSDSAVVKCWVSNIMHNGSRVFWANWCLGKNNDIPDVQPPLSRTHSFSLLPGDRVGVFREFWWYEPHTNAIEPGSYRGSTDVSYSIELLDAASGERIAQLDTIFLRAKQEELSPYFVSVYPAIASIEYTHPITAPARSAFLAIVAKQQGTSHFPLYRIDGFAIQHTQDLNVNTWKEYAVALEAATTAPPFLMPAAQAYSLPVSGTMLRVTGSGNSLLITTVRTPPAGSFVRVADTYGVQYSQLQVPTMQHRIETLGAGLYVVILYTANGEVIESHKTYVPSFK